MESKYSVNNKYKSTINKYYDYHRIIYSINIPHSRILLFSLVTIISFMDDMIPETSKPKLINI